MYFLKTVWLLMLVCLVTTVSAARLPAWYPDRFARIGVIDALDFSQSLVVINDAPYILSDRVVLHSVSEEFDTLDKLAPGETVAIRTLNEASPRPLIVEIWLLPASLNRSAE